MLMLNLLSELHRIHQKEKYIYGRNMTKKPNVFNLYNQMRESSGCMISHSVSRSVNGKISVSLRDLETSTVVGG